jgi:hypothetical protein
VYVFGRDGGGDRRLEPGRFADEEPRRVDRSDAREVVDGLGDKGMERQVENGARDIRVIPNP